MRALFILLAGCLYMMFGYPMLSGIPFQLIQVAVAMGFFGGIIVFFVILTVAYKELDLSIRNRERQSKFDWYNAREEVDCVMDAEYEEEG